MAGKDGVTRVLERLGLEHHAHRFFSHGYDMIQDLFSLQPAELDMLITDKEDKTRFMKALKEDPRSVIMWLEGLGLEQYYDRFQTSGLTDLNKCGKLSPRSLDTMNITLPGHRKRLLIAAQTLSSGDNPRVVAAGKWEEHDVLPGGRLGYFLCLTADVSNPTEDSAVLEAVRSLRVKFLVDSGSDIVTLRDDVIRYLNLSLKGFVGQHGIDGTVLRKPMYHALLGIGESRLKVEVTSDCELNSLGSPVLRHFRHFIDDHKHLWLAKTE